MGKVIVGREGRKVKDSSQLLCPFSPASSSPPPTPPPSPLDLVFFAITMAAVHCFISRTSYDEPSTCLPAFHSRRQSAGRVAAKQNRRAEQDFQPVRFVPSQTPTSFVPSLH